MSEDARFFLDEASSRFLVLTFSGATRTYIFIHVDDTFVCSTDLSEITLFHEILCKKFNAILNPNVKEYLGLKITRLPDGRAQLTQPKLLASIFKEFAAELTAVSPTAPQRPHARQDPDDTPITQKKFLHLLGAFI